MKRNTSYFSNAASSTLRNGLSSGVKAATTAWSTMQIALVAVAAIAAVAVGGMALSGLIVASITTFNLNNDYYGQIGQLNDAILNPDTAPLLINETDQSVRLRCGDGDINLCSYVSFVNESIDTFTLFMNNGSIPNVTLSSLVYVNGAVFMSNASNAKEAMDNVVGEAIFLQNQITGLTLSTLSYSNGAPFMSNVSSGTTALNNLVGEAIYLQQQIDGLVAANGTTTLSTLGYANGATFMFNVSNGKQALDNLVGEALSLQSQIAALPAAPTLSTLSYSNGAAFMVNVSNGKTALDNLVGEAFVLQGQIDGIGLSTLSYTNGAAFMANVTNGKTALDNLVGEALVLQSQITNLPATPTLTTLSYSNGAAFMVNVSNGKTALDNLVGEALDLQSQINAIETRKNLNYYLSVAYGNDITCDGSQRLPCATLYRLLQLLPNVTGQYSQYSIHYDNGFYQENNFVALKPNIILIGNEGGTLVAFYAGLGLDGGSWAATGTGFISVFRFGVFQCVGLCDFDMSAAVPSGPVFSKFSFYNTTLYANADMLFKRRADTSSYYAVVMESVVVNAANNIIFQDVTYVSWSLSGDNYATLSFNYNSTSTTGSGQPIVTLNGLVSHNLITVNNYAAGVTVDWSLMDVINRDGATLTRNYVSGASINVHGDVLSLGAINGGLISTGAGSGITQYLTYAYGMGYTPANTTYWAVSGVPIQVSDALDKVASRLYNLETLLTPSKYTLTGFGTGTNTIDGTSCSFSATFGSATAYLSGPNVFWHDASTITFNGSSTTIFRFQFSAYISYVYSASVGTVGAYNAALVGPSWFASGNVLVPITTSGSAGEGGTMTYVDIVTLNPGDALTMGITITVSAGATFTSCNLLTLTSNRYLSFEQLS